MLAESRSEWTPNFSKFCDFPESFSFVKHLILMVKENIGISHMEKLNYKTKQKRTSNTKQVFLGKGKHLVPEGTTPLNSWEGTTEDISEGTTLIIHSLYLFAYIIFYSSLFSLLGLSYSFSLLLFHFLQVMMSTFMCICSLICVENLRTLQSMSTLA